MDIVLTRIRPTQRKRLDRRGRPVSVYSVTVAVRGARKDYEVFVQKKFAPTTFDSSLITADDQLQEDFREAPVVLSRICHEVGRFVRGEAASLPRAVGQV